MWLLLGAKYLGGDLGVDREVLQQHRGEQIRVSVCLALRQRLWLVLMHQSLVHARNASMTEIYLALEGSSQ